MAPIRQTTAWLWSGAFFLIVVAYGPGLDLPGRALREALLPPVALGLLGHAVLRSRVRPSSWLPVLLGAAGLSTVLGILFSPGPERWAVLRDGIVLVAPWVACLAAASWPAGRDGVDLAIQRAAVVALAGLAALGLVQAWTSWQGIAQIGPPAALFVNRNVAAQAVVPLLLLVPVVVLSPAKSWWRWPAVAAEAAGLTFLLATRSRGAWLALSCGALVAVAVLVRWRGAPALGRPAFARLGAIMALAALAALVPVRTSTGSMPSVRSTFATLAQPTAGSGAVRLALWSNTLAMTESRLLLGHGAGRFPVVYPRYHAARRETPGFGTENQPAHAHNDWLEYAAELGWPAALALAATIWLGLGLCFRRSPAATMTDHGLTRASRAAVLGGVLLHGLLSFPLHAPVGAFVAWIVVGRAWADTCRAVEFRGRQRSVWAILLFVAAAAFLALGGTELRTRAALGRASRSMLAGDCVTALREATEVTRSAAALRHARGAAAMIVFNCSADTRQSLPLLEQALEMHPNHLNLLLAVGARRMNAGQLDGAERAFAAAAELVPRRARPWTGLAMTQALRGDRQAAAASCRKALVLEPELAAAKVFCEANELVPPAP